MSDPLEELCEEIQAWPQRRVSPYLHTLLQDTKSYQKNLLRLVREAYFWSDSPDSLRESLTALSDAGELYCLRRRRTLDNMCKAIQKNDLIHPIPFPSQMDISQDIQISYDEETKRLRVEMPMLLPLKGRWNEYLPGKIRYTLGVFSENYRQEHGQRLRFSYAFVLFVHHYEKPRPGQWYYRDYDNQEYSVVLNALQSTLIFNDGPTTSVTMQMAVPDGKSFTEVIITPVDRMMNLLRDMDFSMYESDMRQ